MLYKRVDIKRLKCSIKSVLMNKKNIKNKNVNFFLNGILKLYNKLYAKYYSMYNYIFIFEMFTCS